MARTIRMLVVVVLALGMAGIGSARSLPAALAQGTPHSLVGETFTLTGGSASGCVNGGTLTFSVSGTATGPYPGTFTESGTASLAGFSATFTIKSLTGKVTVTGRKTGPVTDGGCGITYVGSGFSASPTYTAIINGAYQDTGSASVSLFWSDIPGLALTFSETFDTSNGVVCLENTQGNQNNQGDCNSQGQNT